MASFKIEGVTHWSIPVNNLKESEAFYGEVLGLSLLGRLSNGVMTCFNIGDHNILLCERQKPQDENIVEERVHHSFNVNPEGFVEPRYVNELESSGFFEEMNRQYGK